MSENLPSQKGVLLGSGVLNMAWWVAGGANGAVMWVCGGYWKLEKLRQRRKKKRGCCSRELSWFVAVMVDGCDNANPGVEELVVARGNVVMERRKRKMVEVQEGRLFARLKKKG